tara:strand:+ start:266 stop:517 length:252 start_codon:yes stop_codon:yes gene_type:complete
MSHQDKQNTRIDHLIIVVPDLQDATDQYSVLLGRSPSWQGTHPDYGTANTLFQLDNIYLELLAVKGAWTGSRHSTNVIGQARL